MTIYEYSQLCYIAETLTLGVTLAFIGNKKVQSNPWLKRAKWLITMVFAVAAIITAIRLSYDLNPTHRSIDKALSVTMLNLITFILCIAFFPPVVKSHLTLTRRVLTSIMFLFCIVLAWISVVLDAKLSQIALVMSIAVYLFELVRVTFVFVYDYKTLSKQELVLVYDDENNYNRLNLIVRSIILLSFFALLHISFLMLSDQYKAFYNFAMLAVWAYLFAQVVNLIIEVKPLKNNFLDDKDNHDNLRLPHAELAQKVDNWVDSGAYCEPGITMIQMAQLLSTNRTYLSKYINTRYGCSFNTWLTQLRLTEAKRLLASSPTLPIDSIAKMTGFASKSHFINSFKASEKTTPGKWRMTNAGKQ